MWLWPRRCIAEMFSEAAVASLDGQVKVCVKCFKMSMHKIAITKDTLGSKFENRIFNLSAGFCFPMHRFIGKLN